MIFPRNSATSTHSQFKKQQKPAAEKPERASANARSDNGAKAMIYIIAIKLFGKNMQAK
jgi:hypothetical protein